MIYCYKYKEGLTDREGSDELIEYVKLKPWKYLSSPTLYVLIECKLLSN